MTFLICVFCVWGLIIRYLLFLQSTVLQKISYFYQCYVKHLKAGIRLFVVCQFEFINEKEFEIGSSVF